MDTKRYMTVADERIGYGEDMCNQQDDEVVDSMPEPKLDQGERREAE